MFINPKATDQKVIVDDAGQVQSLEPGDILVREDLRIEILGPGKGFRTASVLIENIGNGNDQGERRVVDNLSDLSKVPEEIW